PGRGPGLPDGIDPGAQQRPLVPPGRRPTPGRGEVLLRHRPVRLHDRGGLLGRARLAVRPDAVRAVRPGWWRRTGRPQGAGRRRPGRAAAARWAARRPRVGAGRLHHPGRPGDEPPAAAPARLRLVSPPGPDLLAAVATPRSEG